MVQMFQQQRIRGMRRVYVIVTFWLTSLPIFRCLYPCNFRNLAKRILSASKMQCASSPNNQYHEAESAKISSDKLLPAHIHHHAALEITRLGWFFGRLHPLLHQLDEELKHTSPCSSIFHLKIIFEQLFQRICDGLFHGK